MTKVRRITKQDAADWESAKQRARSGQPPPPFTAAPEKLEPFLDTLDPSKVYVSHIDAWPATFKRRIFCVPVVLNLTIALLIGWRLYVGLPVYFHLINTAVGHESLKTVQRANKTTAQLLWIVIRRAAMFMLDFVMIKFILPWPVSFFFEQPSNPVFWRLKIGFHDKEIVIRESRGWSSKDLLQGVKMGQDSPFWKTRVLPAIDRDFIRAKTGYMMMDKSWDLDFKAMVDAHTLVDTHTLELDDFDKSVLAFHDQLGWLIWRAHKTEAADAGEDTRAKLVLLKDRLAAMGKESLFFRWIEIVQYESNEPGEFDVAKQRRTLAKIQQAFREQGVDFDQLVKDIGGLDGAPGMTSS